MVHFLQNMPLVQIYTSTSVCKGVGNILGSQFVKAFSALPSHSWWFQYHHKSSVLSMLISIEGTGYKSAGVWSGEYGGCSGVVTMIFVKKFLTKTDRCVGALSWRRNQLSILHFSGHFVTTASLRRWRLSLNVAIFRVLPHAAWLLGYTSLPHWNPLRPLLHAMQPPRNHGQEPSKTMYRVI